MAKAAAQAVEATVNVPDALKYLGYRGQSMDDSLRSSVERIAAMVNGLKPRGLWRTFPIAQASDDGVELAGISFRLPGSHIARHLRNAPKAVLMAVTLGAESERLLRRSSCISSTDGLIADACASSLVEEAADAMTAMVADEARCDGLHAGRRFSPGYGDFPLAAQHQFLEAIDGERLLGIRLTEGDLMVPSKSITAVIPLFDEFGEGEVR